MQWETMCEIVVLQFLHPDMETETWIRFLEYKLQRQVDELESLHE